MPIIAADKEVLYPGVIDPEAISSSTREFSKQVINEVESCQISKEMLLKRAASFADQNDIESARVCLKEAEAP